MALQHQLGQKGEQLAVDYLLKKEFTILHRNWRFSRYEIDIIAEKLGKVHFVEVKLRSSIKYGQPEEKVRKSKFRKILKAADAFLHLHRQYRHVQFDILAVSMYPRGEHACFFIEDVFW